MKDAAGVRPKLALAVGFAMALIGVVNALPGLPFLPRIGPFHPAPLHAFMFMASALAVVLTRSNAERLAKKGREWARAGALADGLILAALAWTIWRFYDDTLTLDDSFIVFGPLHAAAALGGCLLLLVLCWMTWGGALAAFGAFVLLYYCTGEHWPGIFRTAPIDFVGGMPEDLWFNLSNGVMGNLAGIVIGTVFVFVVFGAMMEGSGAGLSLIRVSCALTRRSRGGPAHAAILASGLFGTMSGAPVANVVGTGVLTIPMIKRRGFTPAFAGGVEAAASTGGQIMPPIMGTAALVMANFLGVSYLAIITAALLPAVFYYLSLFFGVICESRRLDIQAGEEEKENMRAGRQDFFNLLIVLIPVGVVVTALLAGFSAAGSGVMALAALLPISFVSPTVRGRPAVLLEAFARGGVSFAHLMAAIGVVGVIVAVLDATGIGLDFANLIEEMVGGHLLPTLLVVMLAAMLLGMGMPTLPAYLTIALVLGPTLTQLGMSLLAAHMFVFYFGVTAAITPPVAIAGYAAATLAGAGPLATAFAALRAGAGLFLVPFVFAYHPQMLLVVEEPDWPALASVCVRLTLAMWLLASALSRHGEAPIGGPQSVLRVALALAMVTTLPLLSWGAFLAGCLLVASAPIKKRLPGRDGASL